MNDAGYGKFNEDRNKTYREKTAAMLEMASKAGVRVALCSPNAVDRRVSPKFSDFKVYLETQKQFYAPLKDIAVKGGARFVDQYAKTRAGLEAMEKDDPEAKKVRPYGDGFHTSPGGGLQMAYAILEGLNAPALVSDAAINAAEGKADAKACKITQIKMTKNGLSFVRADDALPMPMQKDWLAVLPYVKDLNHYGLKVTELGKGNYSLFIDGKSVGKFSSEELAKGVNLGNVMTGPIHDQAQLVMNIINFKNQLVHQRFRGVVMTNNPDRTEELARRQEAINHLQSVANALAQPFAHRWELRLEK